MPYQYSVEDGKGNVLEVRQLYTLEQYKVQLGIEIKEIWKSKFPSIEKQMNLANGVLDESEAAPMREQIKTLLAEYEKTKAAINAAKSLEEAHSVVYG